MMWIVRLALRRPYTFVVFALLILILGIFSIETMPTDIFPNIDIPIVTVVWSYAGLSADQMANRIVSNSERGMTTTVNDIEHIESQSLNGIARHQGLLPAPRERRAGGGADHGHQPGAAAPASAGHDAALHHSVQRIERAGSAAGTFRQRAQRAAALRHWARTRSAPSWPPLKARRRRIPTAASSARSRSTSTCPLCRPRACRPPMS